MLVEPEKLDRLGPILDSTEGKQSLEMKRPIFCSIAVKRHEALCLVYNIYAQLGRCTDHRNECPVKILERA